MRFAPILGLARFELRLTRRLARYWIFLSVAALVGVGSYLGYALLHRFLSAYSASAGTLNPRYLVALFGPLYIFVFLVGLVFLGLDVRSRDLSERVWEVLDSRPLTNLELLVGRFLGLLAAAWIPVLVISAGLACLGLALGEPVEPASLVQFAVLMALPAFAFTLGLVFLVTLAVRRRAVSAVLVLGLLGLLFYASQKITVLWSPAVNLAGGFALGVPSDILRWGADPAGYVQRLGVLLVGVALVLVAAAIHPRPAAGSRRGPALAGGAVLVLAMTMVLLQAFQWHGEVARKRHWRTVHARVAEHPAPDLEAVAGTVRVSPGDRLELELELTFRAPPDEELERATFSLNPGYTIDELLEETGMALEHTFEDGLLVVELPEALPPEQSAHIRLTAHGVPDPRFAYLDAAEDMLTLPSDEAELVLLGFRPLVFRADYVALLDGVRWLPAAGPEVARHDPRRRAPDFYRLELTAELPDGWHPAAPGRRRDEGASDGRRRFRFAPPAPVSETTLVAAPFERRAASVQGVELELLLDPQHTRNLDLFTPAGEEILGWIEGRLSEAEELGLPYPYGGLTLVEVPNALRGYGGTWRMDTTLAPPGLLLMRESSFPTAYFEGVVESLDEPGERVAARQLLVRFFSNDFHGGNLLTGATRNLFAHLTGATGPEAIALDDLFASLVDQLVVGQRGYFSAHIFLGGLGDATVEAMTSWARAPRDERDFDSAMVQAMTSRPEVWESALQVPLAELDPEQSPGRALDVLALKGGELARALRDSLGRTVTGDLLAGLRRAHRGEAFTVEDVLERGEALGVDLGTLLGDWLYQIDLPGFRVLDAELIRLPDDEGDPRYQTRVTLYNGEPVAGLARLDLRLGEAGEEQAHRTTEPIRVPGREAREVGVVTRRPPNRVEVDPYLSRNREPFTIALPTVDEERIAEVEPLEGVRSVEVRLDESAVVVDDLDPGFSIEVPEAGGLALRLGGGTSTGPTDEGLPRFALGTPPASWGRMVAAEAWGRYRHTTAIVRAGEGDQVARFEARLPHRGRWRLELHVPPSGALPLPLDYGTWSLRHEQAGESTEVSFDAAEAEAGWSPVDTLELDGGPVTVTLTNRTTGQVVLADAVRWIDLTPKAER